MIKRLLIFGFGYCAESLLLKLKNSDWKINIVTRDLNKVNKLRNRGFIACQWSDKIEIKAYIEKADAVLVCVPPVGFIDPVQDEFSEFFSKLHKKSKFIYLSSTGVYGDHMGNWVDEKSDVNPTTKLGLWRLNAEKLWLNLSENLGLSLTIMRLSGIYGPNRSPFDKLKKGSVNVIKKQGLLFSRIHVDDITEIIRICLNRNNISGIYNICDNKPASSQQVMEEACRLLGIDCPKPIPIEKLNLSKIALGFYSESKKVCNKKILEELKYEMIHPNYFSGLRSIIKKAG